MKIYNIYQSGKRLYIDEKEIPDNKIVVNKYDNMQQTLRLISDGTLPPRLYWALRNPKLSNKYFILPLINNEDLIVGTDISAYVGLWDILLIGTDDDYIIEGTDIDQSRLTYVSDHFGRLFVRDNFLEELDFEEQCSPTFKIFYDEIIDKTEFFENVDLSEYAKKEEIPTKTSQLDNDSGFITKIIGSDDGNGNITIEGSDTIRDIDGEGNGENGKDGIGITETLINDEGKLVITYSDGNSVTLGKVVGEDGKNGINGKSAYEYAQDGGYEGTEEQFAQKMAQVPYSKTEIDTMFGTYVDEVAELVGGGA